MFEIIAIIAVVLAIAIAIILIVAATKPNTFSIAGKDFSADQRLSSVGDLVALRKQGSGDEAQL